MSAKQMAKGIKHGVGSFSLVPYPYISYNDPAKMVVLPIKFQFIPQEERIGS